MPTVFHIGLPKTGTTTLQFHFFPGLPGCVALGPLPYGSPFRILAQNLERADDDEFLEATWRAFLTDTRGGADTLVVSREGFSRPAHRARIADRLHAIAPDARIVICVREQHRILQSFYSQYLRDGGVMPLVDWLPGFEEEWFFYGDLVAMYQERFGAGAVHVTAFERFTSDPHAYFAALADFVRPGTEPPADRDVPVENPALSGVEQNATRLVNRWFRRSKFNADPIVPSKLLAAAANRLVTTLGRSRARQWATEQPPEATAALDRYVLRYRETNDRLAELTDLPIAELGYVVSPSPTVGSASPLPAPSRR